jgi:hypothetical protein
MLSFLPREPGGSASSMGEFLATKATSVAVIPSLQKHEMRGPKAHVERGHMLMMVDKFKRTHTLTMSGLAPEATSTLTASTYPSLTASISAVQPSLTIKNGDYCFLWDRSKRKSSSIW